MSDSTSKPLPLFQSDDSDISNLGPPIFSDQYDGSMRHLYPRKCLCGTIFYLPKHLLNANRFCSVKCSAKTQLNRLDFTCDYCGKDFQRPASKAQRSKRGYYFCSRACKDLAQSIGGIEGIQPDHYGNGIHNYRIRALRHNGAKCSNCGYDEYTLIMSTQIVQIIP
jgi:hypothetical protein